MDTPDESLRLTAGNSAPFVGRRREFAQLCEALGHAVQGRARIVLIAGPAGIGKTRLAVELAAHAGRLPATVLWGRCLEEPGTPAYWPWIQILRSCLAASPQSDLDLDLDPRVLERIAVLLPEAVPPGAGSPAARQADSMQTRFQCFDAVARLLLHVSRAQPLLVIFDDLHNADPSSLRLLVFLASQLGAGRLLVLANYRDNELSRRHPLTDALAEMARSAAFSRAQLAGLTHRETQQFMTAASGSTPSEAWVRAMHERTEGHPLFLAETVRSMMEFKAQVAVWHADPDLQPGAVPNGVRDVIGQRLNRLSVSAVRLLGMAACIGRSFELRLLSQLDAEKSEDEVLAALEEALALHLIEPHAESGQCRFSHALIRETLYDEMLAVRRVKLHHRIGELLEQHHGSASSACLPQLAYHFGEAAGDGAAIKALAYAQLAAEQSARRLAHEEAARLYRQALRLQHAYAAVDVARRCELLLALGQVQYTLGAGEASRAAFNEVAQTARTQSFSSMLARAAIGFEMSCVLASRSGEPAMTLLQEALAAYPAQDVVCVELLASLCRACVYCDRPTEAAAAHRQAVALARRVGDPRGLFLALASIVSAGYWPELLPQRLAAAREAWQIAESSQGLHWTLAELIAFYLCDLIRAGDLSTLRTVLDADRRISQQAGSLYHEAMGFCTETVMAINEGRFADAERLAVQSLQTGRRVAEDIALGAYGMQMFCLRREQGRLGEVLPMLLHFVRNTPSEQTWRPGLALLYAELGLRAECLAAYESLAWGRIETSPKDAGSFTVIVFAAEVCAYLDDASRAALLYRLLEAHAGSNLMADLGGPCLGSADRVLGQLAGVLRQWPAAEQHFKQALTMDAATGACVWLAHSRCGFALMLLQRGRLADRQRARDLLDQALADSVALGMNALTPRITAALQTLAAPTPAFPCGLTQREVDVLRLIAIGRNNRDIAQVLAISVNTVANHVRSILDKTYTSNRTEAAAFANHHGLSGRSA